MFREYSDLALKIGVRCGNFRTNPLRAEPDRSRTSSRLGETRTDWNAERSEGTQTFPQAARRKIQEDTQLRGECATCGVKQMNGKRLNLKVCQDDPQRTVIYRVGTLVVQSCSGFFNFQVSRRLARIAARKSHDHQ